MLVPRSIFLYNFYSKYYLIIFKANTHLSASSFESASSSKYFSGEQLDLIAKNIKRLLDGGNKKTQEDNSLIFKFVRLDQKAP